MASAGVVVVAPSSENKHEVSGGAGCFVVVKTAKETQKSEKKHHAAAVGRCTAS